VICGKQYFVVWTRLSAMNVLLNLPAFYRWELEFSPDFWGRKWAAFYAPVHLINTKRRYLWNNFLLDFIRNWSVHVVKYCPVFKFYVEMFHMMSWFSMTFMCQSFRQYLYENPEYDNLTLTKIRISLFNINSNSLLIKKAP
jgi:hypothetical protein